MWCASHLCADVKEGDGEPGSDDEGEQQHTRSCTHGAVCIVHEELALQLAHC